MIKILHFPSEILVSIIYLIKQNKKSYRHKRPHISCKIVIGYIRLTNDERMKAGRIVFCEKTGANREVHDKLPAIITRISFVGGDGSRFIFLLTARRWMEEFRLLRPSAARISWESGQWSWPSPRTFLAHVLRRAYGRVFFFSLSLPATGHFLGSGRTSFRFSVHCVPSCLVLSSPARRECADVALARERVQPQDRIIPTCSCHARTYTDARACRGTRRILYVVRERYFRVGTHAATRFA